MDSEANGRGAGAIAKAGQGLVDAMCRRLPAWVTPNGLTVLGLGGALLVLAGFVCSNSSRLFLLVCLAGLAMQWFGDRLDGALARLRKIERPRFGMYLDQIVDAVSALFIFAGLGLSPWVRLDVALIAYAAYLLPGILFHLRAEVIPVAEVARFRRHGLARSRFPLAAMIVAMVMMDARPVTGWLGGLGAFDLIMCAAAVYWIGRWAAGSCAVVARLSAEEPPGVRKG